MWSKALDFYYPFFNNLFMEATKQQVDAPFIAYWATFPNEK